jgi:outer membrane receptor protein involved in Fe transport
MRTQDVPIAMSALLGDTLSAAGITDVTGLARQLTTLDLQSNAGPTTASLRIRRVGNIGNIPTFEPAVAVLVDGAFRSRSFLGTSDLLGVERVEVLRGPQTASYGKHASAGLVAIHTRAPAERFSIQGGVTAGRIDSPETAGLTDAELDMSGPIARHLSGGIAARMIRHDHTLHNVLPNGPDGDDQHRLAVRGQLSWRPGASVVRLLAGYMRERSDQGESDVFLAPGAASTQVSGVLQALGLTPSCSDNLPRNRELCSVATNEIAVTATDWTLLGEYPLRNGWRLKSVTGFEQYDILRLEDDAIQLFAPIFFYHDAEQGVSRQQEITLESGPDSAVTWLAGLFYYQNDYERGDDGRQPMFGPNGDLAFHEIWPALLGIPLATTDQLGLHDSTLDTRYVSAFGYASWELTPKLSLTARLRWQRERKEAAINNGVTAPGTSLISAILTPATTLAGRPVNGALERTTDDVPWSITPHYRFGDRSIFYLTLARGSKSGGFNTGFGDAPLAEREYNDETVRHYELGAKLTLGDRRVLVQTAAFRTRYDEYQNAAFVSTQFSVGNAERVSLRGMEIDATIPLRERWSMDLSVSYADLRYVTNTDGLCYPGRPPDGSSPSSCDLAGERPIHAPEWETHVGVQYQRMLTRGELSFRADWSWTDDYNTSFSADPRLVQGAYSALAVRVGMRFNPRHEVVLWGDNVLDETISHYDSLLNLFNDASYQSYLAAPRSYGLTWNYRF